MENFSYQIKPSVNLIRTADERFILAYQDKHFSVGELLFQLIGLLKENKSISEILEFLKAEKKLILTPQQLTTLIDEKIAPLNIFAEQADLETKADERKKYVYAKIELISEQFLQKVIANITWLFDRKVFSVLFPISILVSGAFAWHLMESGNFVRTFLVVDSVQLLVLGYLTVAFLMLWHELGHAAASGAFKVPPKSIGFGLYLLFPVFYTDVSRIWVLDKAKRILVNVAGVYFQLIANLFLIGAYAMVSDASIQVFLRIAISINAVICVYSLNPFFRNDGYWIYSDFFNLPNLNTVSYKFPAKLFNTITGKEKIGFFKTLQKEWPILIHSIGYYILWGTCFYYFGRFFIQGYKITEMFMANFEGGSITDIPALGMQYILKLLFFVITLIFFAVRIIRIYVPFVFKFIKNIFYKSSPALQ